MEFFEDLFDFNGDGKVTSDEEFLAFKMFEEDTKEDDDFGFDDDLDNCESEDGWW